MVGRAGQNQGLKAPESVDQAGPPLAHAEPSSSAASIVVLTIAGFDPSSGAGITADLQSFAAHGLFGTAVITALTVQSTLGVAAVQPTEPKLLRHMLQHLIEDLPPCGIKIGMLGSAEAVGVIEELLHVRSEKAARRVVVLDPVLRSSSGRDLFPPEAIDLFKGSLLPLVDWVTPNWSELSLLSGRAVRDLVTAEQAAIQVGEQYPKLSIVATGGEGARPVDLLRLPDGQVHRFEGDHVATRSTHGTGCAFSSALLARLVLGASPAEAVASAKAFVEGALRHAPALGRGWGPMDLLWPMRGR